MSELKKAIEDITYRSRTFPEEAFRVIKENREEAIPFLREAVRKAIVERDDLDKEEMLHFYAIFLLGQFQDRDFFPEMIEFVSLPEEVLDMLIGDAATEGLSDILYCMYNGDLELLKDSIMEPTVGEYVRAALLQVLAQLYLDGKVREDEFKSFLKQTIYCGMEPDYLYEEIEGVICRCHFVDMLPDIRYLREEHLVEGMLLGDYADCVDEMFAYEEEEAFCRPSIDAAESLRHWAMFDDDRQSAASMQRPDKKDFEKALRRIVHQEERRPPKQKIGRNDPCPCGSGKKYKFCCMNKPKSPLDQIEEPEIRKKWLEDYPCAGGEKLSGRVYLEDYFDAESIEIDQLLYLGMKRRPGLIRKRDDGNGAKRKMAYLELAFQACVRKAEKEQIRSLDEYDAKYSIHYLCREWLGELEALLKKDGEMETCRAVRKWVKKMT